MIRSTLISRLEPAGLLVGRLLLATIFLHESIIKLGNFAGAEAFARAYGVSDRLLPPAIAAELVCGALIALGAFSRIAALVLAGFCLVTAVVFHTKFSDVNQLLHFEKNLGLAGGLIILAVCGAGPYAIGKWFSSRT